MQGAGKCRSQLVQSPAEHRAFGQPQQAASTGIDQRDFVVKVEGDNARRRGRQDLVHEVVLFLQPRALFAQLVDHAVVHAHELIHFWLAHFDELASEIALADEFGTRADQIERHPKMLDQAQADRKRQDEECFNPQ